MRCGCMPQVEADEDVKRDMYHKMEMLLEENSLHNIQLRQVVESLGHEVQRLDTRAKDLEREHASALKLTEAEKADLLAAAESGSAEVAAALRERDKLKGQIASVSEAMRRLENACRDLEAERDGLVQTVTALKRTESELNIELAARHEELVALRTDNSAMRHSEGTVVFGCFLGRGGWMAGVFFIS
jgi:predicted LPLAT superfamily acyltransferase